MIKPVAIHLPQFHPFNENDEWWGKGFTEWTNVAKARPYFDGHEQPHLPADLGFYDLRLEEARTEQIALAKQYGIHGFCYYHYWFNGTRLMHEPLDRMLANREEDFPFMYCWANENWSRRWDGAEQEVLIAQHYSSDDDEAHMLFLCRNVFSDKRYIRVDDKPFFLIYRPGLIPDIKSTIEMWRKIARQEGIGEIYLGYMQSFGLKDDPVAMGFDCAVNFQPDFYLPLTRIWGNIPVRLKNKIGLQKSPYIEHIVYDYNSLVQLSIAEGLQPNVYPCVTPGWDNAARRKKEARIFLHSNPDKYGEWLKAKMKQLSNRSNSEFVFINAWNEWAEGNHLEPCSRWGRQYLEVTKNIVDEFDK